MKKPIFIGMMLIFLLPILACDTLTPPIATPIPSPTATHTQTPRPTATSTVTPRPTRTPTATRRPIPTRTPWCNDWSTATLDDLGRTMCVQGIVHRVWWDDAQGASFVTFSPDAGAFYLVLYGWYFTDLGAGDCVYATGEIGRLANAPVMTIDAYDLYVCDP